MIFLSFASRELKGSVYIMLYLEREFYVLATPDLELRIIHPQLREEGLVNREKAARHSRGPYGQGAVCFGCGHVHGLDHGPPEDQFPVKTAHLEQEHDTTRLTRMHRVDIIQIIKSS